MSTTERNTVAEPGTITRDGRRIIRRHIELATALPAPGEIYIAGDFVECDGIEMEKWRIGNTLRQFEGAGIVHDEGTFRREYGRGEYRSIQQWSTSEQGHEAIRELLAGAEDALLPCGHSAFVNDGELVCKVCRARFAREEVDA